MSSSHTYKTILAIVVALALGIFSGCGGNADDPSGNGSTPASAAISGSEADAGPTAGPEGEDLAPVDLKLEDGGFAQTTPAAFHVPSGFLVLITAENVSDAKIRLSVSAPSLAQTFLIGPGRTETITLASIGADESAKMISGGRTIRIVADAEPGP